MKKFIDLDELPKQEENIQKIFPLRKSFLSLKNWFRKNKKRLLIMSVIFIIFIFLLYILPLGDWKYQTPSDIEIKNGEFIEIESYKTYIVQKGIENPNTITFLHGFGASSFSWRNNLDFFVELGLRVVAIDLKGFGLSDKRFDTDYDHVTQAEFVSKILSQIGVSKSVIVGHSMGGNIAVHFAQLFPERTDALILIAPAILDQVNFIYTSLARFTTLPIISQIFRHTVTRYFNEDNLRSMLGSVYFKSDFLTEEDFLSYSLPTKIRDWDLSLLGLIRDFDRNVLPTKLEEMSNRPPTLLVWGANDNILSPDIGMSLNANLRDAVFKVVPNAGHSPMEESSTEFNKILEIFLEDRVYEK